jgi:hypothetical protein
MQLKVKGKGKIKPAELQTAIEIMMKIMKAHRLLPSLEITVRFKNMKTHAQVEEVDEKEFVIDISNSLSKLNTLLALAHELVHIKQFCRKELKMEGPHIVYRGEVFDPKKVHYYDLPHEIEAYGRETGLVDRYMEQKRILAKRKKSRKSRT